jgi:murein hydrolase activator
MLGSEDAFKRSLESRRTVIADVLASLQRMGRQPLPTLLARPEDVLESIRTSMLLGAVLPELRAETEALAADLADLLALRQSITNARDGLARHAATLTVERLRLSKLIEAKHNLLADAEAAMQAERARAAELAKGAASLKELIAKMENEISSSQRAADQAKKAEVAQKLAAEADATEIQRKIDGGAFKDASRLAPAVPFGEAKGLLPTPVAGTVVKGFGSPDGFGGSEKGMSFRTLRQGSVVSPTDGWVSYAGPYRTYGQLLIINAGGGYYVVLAGMSSVKVDAGQFVLAGEPVAFMDDKSARAAAAIAAGVSGPVLYVEFRKDGIPIDPGPWWAKSEVQKVSG